MKELIFYDETETVEEQSEDAMSNIFVLAIGAEQLEKVLANKLSEMVPGCKVLLAPNNNSLKGILEAERQIDLIICLRKNTRGGVEDPIGMIKDAKRHSPQAEGLIIVGSEDETGKKMMIEATELGIRALSGKGSPISLTQIETEISNVQKGREKNKCEVKSKSNIYVLESAKGGSGATAIMAQLAQGCVNKGLKALMVDLKGGLHHWFGVEGVDDDVIKVKDHLSLYQRPTDLAWGIWSKEYDVILVDGLESRIKDAHHILIVDPSAEASVLAKSKLRLETKVILNHFLSDVMPVEVMEQDLSRSFSLVLEHQRQVYQLAEASHNPIPIELEALYI